MYMDNIDQKETKVEATDKSSKKPFLYGVIVFLVIVLLGGYFYVNKATKNLSQNNFVLKVASALNLPAAKVNGNTIPYADYIRDLNTLEKFYAQQSSDFPAFTQEQISDQVLSRMIVNAIFNDLAKVYDISVSDEEIEEFLVNLLPPNISEEQAAKDLQEQYGWDFATYKSKIVEPLVIEQKVQEAFVISKDEKNAKYDAGQQVRARHILFRTDQDGTDVEAKKKLAESIQKRAIEGEDFATLAAEFGEDSTKEAGGDLGWFGPGVMVPDFEQAAFALEPGNVTKTLVESPFGFHIIKVDEKRSNRNFVAYMDDQLDNADIKIVIGVHNPFENIPDDAQVPAVEAIDLGEDVEQVLPDIVPDHNSSDNMENN
jgi:parvulin-like peptidyl-prolyl isomerase